MPLPDFSMFSNRLRKMLRHHGKWARRKGISCFRVYDADIPEFPLVLDYYDGYLHVAEYKRDHSLSEQEYRIWRSGCREAMKEVFGIPAERIFFKERKPQKGSEQYERVEEKQHQEIIVEENGLRFYVNLSDYLDTGLFLDHRITRQWVREQSKGKRFLNLFAYTGSFTVYAAAGGAETSLTIDLSNTYLDWARRNLELNGMNGAGHEFLQADVLEWLKAPPEGSFDLIVLDPPTFSNSKRMQGILDVQRDHPFLLRRCYQRLAPGGVLYFSTNFRRFKLDPPDMPGSRIKDVSAASIPQDFRNKKIHYCFEIVKKSGNT
jgi:23S rRNA (cytosine1962-C5)-methyltransferase